MSQPVLSVRSLSKCFELYDRPLDRLKQTLWRGRRRFYREHWALRDVSFSLAPRQVLGVVGRNGSGKSTLLQLVAGTLTPTAGELEMSGRVSALLELGSGFNPEFTGRENVMLNGAILGVPADEMRALMPELLEFAGIGQFVDQPVKTYSSGMALRLAFAVATAVTPRILIVDEALAVGDEAFQRKCFARIESIRDSGAAILFVSHSPTQILELCDVALLLDGGEMLLQDEPKHIVSAYQRLLYGSEDTARRVRGELRGKRHDARDDVSVPPPVPPAPEAGTGPEPRSARPAFDPELRSASIVEFASRGARISDPRITTEEGEVVNVLARNRDYVLRYQVAFAAFAQRVRFGMMIKTTSGVELGGCVAHPADSICEAIQPGACVTVAFRFHCILNPGTYFLNAGVMGDVDGEETYLHRLVDAAAFRVAAGDTPGTAGYVDFSVRGSVNLMTGDHHVSP
ncbi:MAG: ABC transporter ATP-binding protein [Burkholderiales bacterium]